MFLTEPIEKPNFLQNAQNFKHFVSDPSLFGIVVFPQVYVVLLGIDDSHVTQVGIEINLVVDVAIVASDWGWFCDFLVLGVDAALVLVNCTYGWENLAVGLPGLLDHSRVTVG